MTERVLHFNGVNGSTGAYGLEPMTDAQLSAHIVNIEEEAPDNLEVLQKRALRDKLERIREERVRLEKLLEMATEDALIAELERQIADLKREEAEQHLGVVESVDATKMEEAGWGIIFGAKNPNLAQLKEALKPLLDLRQEQTGEYFRLYEKGEGCRPDESASKFLQRHGARVSDPAAPENVPYYLLIVGNPEEIDYRFQYQLDVQYAVGRIDFGDDFEACYNYANSVARAARGDVRLSPQATFFGVANPDDRATKLSADNLIQPLFDALTSPPLHPPPLGGDRGGGEGYEHWQMSALLRDEATKAALSQLLNGGEAPAFLFTASHGMEFNLDDTRQRPHQGALLCQDWPGPNQWRGEIPQDLYLAGDDLTDDANLLGMIAFFFACFGGGTPLYDEFSKAEQRAKRRTIAERPFVAALPQAMLRLSKGGALAVVGHVDRAWGSSFLDAQDTQQIGVFQSAVESLLKGKPVGMAMEYFDSRYAALSTELTVQLEQIDFGGNYEPYELAGMWASNNDARGYVIVGDPAVRLPVAQADEGATGRTELTSAPLPTITAPTTVARPPEIPEADWAQTPESVKRYIGGLQ
jgi:hypothetical protein